MNVLVAVVSLFLVIFRSCNVIFAPVFDANNDASKQVFAMLRGDTSAVDMRTASDMEFVPWDATALQEDFTTCYALDSMCMIGVLLQHTSCFGS